MAAIADPVDPLNDATGSEPIEQRFTFNSNMPIVVDSDGVTAEAIRALRSTLLAQHVHKGRRSLAICAPSAGAGCSFLAANLAVSMAQLRIETLLVDANLRDPALDQFITPALAVAGLAECLADPALPLAGKIQRVQGSLSVLYAGGVDPGAPDMLASHVFRSFVGTCLRDYELTIFDTPAANHFADVQRIASAARYALVVTCRQRTYLSDVRTLIADLENNGTAVVGTYLNDY